MSDTDGTNTAPNPSQKLRSKHRKVVQNARAIDLAMRRIALEIAEANDGLEDIAVVGIHRRGVPLGKRLIRLLMAQGDAIDIPFGMVDITLYRDDVMFQSLPKPQLNATEIDFDVTGKRIVLVDDVLYTGRTIRAALDAIMDYGRPSSIQLAVLADRGGRELPIQPDYCGKQIEVGPRESVRVHVSETDGEDRVYLIREDPSEEPREDS
jgi:pyrimidine operon attenuation protein / uracil phosphoribosyltransferase